MNAIDLIVPGDITTPTGGYIYDREILASSMGSGITGEVLFVDCGYNIMAV